MGRRRPEIGRRVPLGHADGGFHLWRTGASAQLPAFTEVTFNLWLRVTGNTANDATIVQWVWQEDIPNLIYWQIFRLRWFRSSQRVSVEIFDPTAYSFVYASNHTPFSVPRGKLVNLHGYWQMSLGFTGWVDGVQTVNTPLGVTPNPIDGSYADWHAVCGGQDIGSGLINQLQGDIGPLWVGFNQNRPVTDFITSDLKAKDLPVDGDVGGGPATLYFDGNHNRWNELRAGYNVKYPTNTPMTAAKV